MSFGRKIDPATRTVDRAVSTAFVFALVSCFHGGIQVMLARGGDSSWAAVLAPTLFIAGLGMGKIGWDLRRRKRWALIAMEAFTWLLLAVSIGIVSLTAWAMWALPLSSNEEMAGGQVVTGRVLLFLSVPWCLALGYDIYRLRRPGVRALMSDVSKSR